MKKNPSFKIVDRDKRILWIVISIVTLLFLASFIATSFGHIDEDFSAAFYKSMDSKFFRGWASYTINDGYISSVPFGFFYGAIIAEGLYKWKKKNNPNGWFANHQKSVIWWLIGLGIAALIVDLYISVPLHFSDSAMGRGFDKEFIIGMDYQIPEFTVSLIVNNLIYIVLVIYLHKVIAKRPNFIETKPWRQGLYNLLFMLVMMIIINVILKNITGRPYWYNIHFTDSSLNSSPLSKLYHDYPDAYYKYINQTNTNWGWMEDPSNRWIPNSNTIPYEPGKIVSWVQQPWNGPTNWPWWKLGTGWIHTQYDGHFYNDAAWPSGHMASTTTMCLCATFLFNSKIKSKKHSFWKWFWIVIVYLYILDVAFALQASTSHWWSDTSFTVVIVPFGYLFSKWTINSIMNSINKRWNLTI